MRRSAPALVLLPLALAACSHAAAERSSRNEPGRPPASAPVSVDLTRYVDPFVGTAGAGNTFPGASAPHGMVQWSPDTSAGGLYRPGGYNSGDLIIRGFSLTHLSGAGCVSFENIPIMPTLRPIASAPQANGSPYSDRFVAASEQASPGFYAVRLASSIRIALSTTTRTGFGRFTFPAAGGTLLLDAGNAAGGKTNIDGADTASVTIRGTHEVVGSARAGHFCGLPNRYTIYFAARFDRSFAGTGVWEGGRLRPGDRAASGARAGAYVRFDTRHVRTVQMKLGLSYVSIAGAEENLAREDPGWSLATVSNTARTHWNDLLSLIQVSGGSAAQRRTFYTALYHSLLAPTVFSDSDGAYRGFDGRIHQNRGHTQYANFSGWDIYRSQVPLLAWLEPQATSDMMQSLVNDAREGGWLPKWPVANDYTGEMDGDSADPILAAAVAFGAGGFDRRAALRAMVSGATRAGAGRHGYLERPQLATYLRRGYVMPVAGGWGAAAETLEYTTDDFAIARMAAMLGDSGVATRFADRSRTWRRLFNPATSFIETRAADGSFPADFNPYSTAGFVEGDAFQYLWMVPHDLPALGRLLGGRQRAVARLDAFFRQLNAGPNAPYDWAGNEPSLGTPWEYDFFGRPDRTREVVHRIMTRLYADTRSGLPGNDDLGTLSAWYVWAALGLYPEIPGEAGLALGAPLFLRIQVSHGDDRTLRILAPPPGTPTGVAMLDGSPLRGSWLPLNRLNADSTLRFKR